MKRILLIPIILVFMSGCAHVISEDTRSRADTGVSLSELFQHPDAYRGRIVIAGGTIADALNRNDGTYIEVVQQPLNYRGIPKYSDHSFGRFIIVHQGYLDPALFSRGRYVTVAGEVIGSRIQKLDEMDSTYPVIKSIEIKLVHPDRGIPVYFGVGISHSF